MPKSWMKHEGESMAGAVKSEEQAGAVHRDRVHPDPVHPDPVHPGEILREDFMKPLGLSANALAIALRVPVTRISEIVRERRAISVETAMRLGHYFGTSTEFWIDVQKTWEVAVAQEMLPRIRAEVCPAEVRPADREWKDRQAAGKQKGLR